MSANLAEDFLPRNYRPFSGANAPEFSVSLVANADPCGTPVRLNIIEKWENVPTFDILSIGFAGPWSFCEPSLVRLETDHDGATIQRLRTYGLSRRLGGPVLMRNHSVKHFQQSRHLPVSSTPTHNSTILHSSPTGRFKSPLCIPPASSNHPRQCRLVMLCLLWSAETAPSQSKDVAMLPV